ncbi:hypothetical protein PILCRDRAFT_829099 [Piloderma croceum F 1598]|uniref:Uncharacterized protein n=1 Tax=Piloderma croceum (strain F 1598) TaxID=765440 RepID=A0A0C3ELQ3_PILCF|nr:hypothetical protein PILCRDRAFT_829099 [Piloderma croceum F 1598]
MKFLSLVTTVFMIATAALAQNITIGSPANNTKVSPGETIIVQIMKPNGLSSSMDISAVIAINTCTTSCPSLPQQQLGVVVFAGPFSPVQSGFGYAAQNYTVQLPSSLPTGKEVLLIALHFGLIGAGPAAEVDGASISLLVE